MSRDFYLAASSHMEKSWNAWEEGRYLRSFGHTVPARLNYLSEMIVSAVKLPFAIIHITFGLLHALATWNRKSPVLQRSSQSINRTSNRLFLSAFGATLSPAITHKYRDADVARYIIAARIVVISGAFLYAFLRR
jgi:hypothetical protein